MTVLHITTLGARGEGVAEHEGRRIFVPFALPGETIEADITGDRGTLSAVHDPSPDRVAPFCPHFGVCGGCQLQHLGPALYARFKNDLVRAPLERAGLAADAEPLLWAQGDRRRRATLHARKEGAGYMKLRTHQVHDIDRCPILAPALAPAPDITRAIGQAIGEADVSLAATESGIDVAIRAGKAEARRAKSLPAVANRFNLARVALNGEVVVQSTSPTLSMGPGRVHLPPGGFLQATAAAEEILASLVLEGAARAKTVADLFCGIGPFALRLALGARVQAFDSDALAIAALDHAARNTRGLKPLVARKRDLFREPLTRFELEAFEAVVLDPPRAGAEAQSRELAASPVPRVVMVSCDPGTFARDAALLSAGGYRLERLVPVDQFAWSAHVELVGHFVRSRER